MEKLQIKQKLKKLFGGVEIRWKTVIIAAVLSGIYTAIMALAPGLRNTSFHTVAVTFEVWILFGIVIIMNARSCTDAALKCFVFFLISQPLVYLLQVPFNPLGWELFRYYRYWLLPTLLCLPMGFFGYLIKKDKWWGYLLLFPMIFLTALSFKTYLSYFTFCRPFYLLACIFCVGMMLLYPNVLFCNKKIKIVGTLVSAVLILGIALFVMAKPYRYSADLLSTVDGKDVTPKYSVRLEDDSFGDVSVMEADSEGFCLVRAEFRKRGKTELIVMSPEGEEHRYDLAVELQSYELSEK